MYIRKFLGNINVIKGRISECAFAKDVIMVFTIFLLKKEDDMCCCGYLKIVDGIILYVVKM